MVPMKRLAAVVVALVFLAVTLPAQERERASIPDKYKWDLTPIYATETAWRAAKDRVRDEVPAIGQFKGKLGSSAATLAEALEKMTALQKEISRVSTYASLVADEDTRDSVHQGMRQETVALSASFSSQAAYIQPEVLRIPQQQLRQFVETEPRLSKFRFFLEDIARRAAHTLGDSEEKILASLGPVAQTPSNTFGVFMNAEFPAPAVTLRDGKTVKVDEATFTALRTSGERSDRQAVMSAFFETLGRFGGTLGTTMNGNVQNQLLRARSRNYRSDLESRLDGPNIPASVYSHLLEGVDRSLPTFHRYLKLRRRMLGVEELHYYDLYAPLVGSVELTYSPEEAEKNILAALAPLGTEYTTTARRVFDERWIDLYPNAGKTSGGYSSGGAFDVHPYILYNYNNQYNDMSGVAHEIG